MQVVHERCRGLGVHKKVVAACVLTPGAAGRSHQELRVFAPMTDDLERRADWLVERALSGRVGARQRFLLAQQLAHIDFLDERITRLDAEVAERTRPCEEVITRLDTIPGVSTRIAQILVAEIGVKMDRSPPPGHLAAWAGMCPGNHESAGKRHRGETRRGNPALRRALVQAAHAAGRTKNTDLGAQDRRLAARRGAKRAAVAVGHSITTIAYYLMTRGTLYQDLGPLHSDTHDRDAVRRRLVARREKLGYTVTTEAAAA